ncbi:MAG TPA: MoxR family ATPase [Anaeromyxobacter sp.]|nr:MoxR family ATPase [Anaeromyxobacter sp.]
MFGAIEEVAEKLTAVGYLPTREIATSVFLADRMEKPVLVEGPAGAGKTELARAFALASGRTLIRLQCYEGLDESKALYEWEYAKQLLYTQLLRERVGEALTGASSLSEAADRIADEGNVFFSERFLLPRPVLRAILSDVPALLLVDEIDKADPELEAFLLEVLSEWAVSVPEIGTVRARLVPRVVLTSNATRDLSDALKRRCLHLHLDLPTRERELAIVRVRVPEASERLAKAVVGAVQKLRTLDLKKDPSISETLDWARALALMGTERLDAESLDATLNLVLKYEADVVRARGRRGEVLAAAEAEQAGGRGS